ncbi:nucleolin-like [Gossypium australe]|uniref:Nucleolin-like n=1 Tax=Gossypium australe TaxID=47621 RepID=A0A5B6VVT6_9ROSI|nr:nucleolin-like [Gossypium australe]
MFSYDHCGEFPVDAYVDCDKVVNGSPWTFNNHLLLLHVLKDDEDPLEVSLLYTTFWVQIQNFPTGMLSEAMARQFGDFIGTFLDYDEKSVVA